jgi:hypothetical protein
MLSLLGFFAQQDSLIQNIALICCGAAMIAVGGQFIPGCPNCIIFITVTELPQTN